MTGPELALAIWTAVHPSYAKQKDAPQIANAIVQAVDDVGVPTEFGGDRDLTIGTVAYYVAKESGVSVRPFDLVSWDAKAGVSCGILQEPCAFVANHTLKQQVAWWLRNVQDSSLGSVDSSPTRAAKRVAKVKQLLAKVKPQNALPQDALLQGTLSQGN